MSESARARERLDFEAAAEAIGKGQLAKGSSTSSQRLTEFSAGGLQFTSGGIEVCFLSSQLLLIIIFETLALVSN